MRIKIAYLIVACIAMVCCVVPVVMAKETENQAVAVVFVPTDQESVDLVPVEPRPDADDARGEMSLSDFDSLKVTPASLVEKVPAVNISLSTIAEKESPAKKEPKNPTVLDDSLLVSNTRGEGDGCGDLASRPRRQLSCRQLSHRQLWVRADYLLWWTRGSDIPPLVTTSTDQADNGILGQPTTEILFGGSRQNSVARSAPRITMGYWFDCRQRVGIQLDYFNLAQADNNYSNFSDGSTLLARPFYSVLTPGQAVELIAKEDLVEGRVRVESNDYFDSFGILGRWNICCRQACRAPSCGEEYCGQSCDDSCGSGCSDGRNSGSLRYFLNRLTRPVKSVTCRVDFIAGYRSYNLDDNLSVIENLSTLGNFQGAPPGTTFDVHDSFRATNEFHGGELGFIATAYRGRWSCEMMVKMALGNNSQVVSINGSTDIDRPGDDPAHFEGGLLALETNIGRYHHNEFVVIPQLGIELGYCLSERVRAYCGYNFLYWAHVARAAEQIDTDVNTSFIPPVVAPSGERVPAFSFQDSGFWAQGLNFGLECHF